VFPAALNSMAHLAAAPSGPPVDAFGNLDFDALYQSAMQMVAAKAEKKDTQGNFLFADLCEFLCAEFPDAASRQHFASQLQELEQRCLGLLGSEVASDTATQVVPVAPLPAHQRPVGAALPTHRLRLWQLGFAEDAAVRGAAPNLFWAGSDAVSTCFAHGPLMPTMRTNRCTQHLRRDHDPGEEREGRRQPN